MAFRELIKNTSFLFGLLTGILLTFASYIPPIGKVFELIFDNIDKLSPLSGSGILSSIIHSYLLSILIFLVVKFMYNKKLIPEDFIRFSLGFFSAWMIFILMSILAISQFEFAQ